MNVTCKFVEQLCVEILNLRITGKRKLKKFELTSKFCTTKIIIRRFRHEQMTWNVFFGPYIIRTDIRNP